MNDYNNKKIAVVIPSFKVSKHIENVINTIPDFVDSIIVVDDFCPEKSGNIAASLNNDKVIVVYHSENQGVGGAMISGYQKALDLNIDVIVKIDGDGQMDPLNIKKLIYPLIHDKAAYCKGNRFNDFKALKKMPKLRLFGNSLLSFIVKLASGYWNIMDPTNGFSAVSAEALKNLNLDTINKRYFFETDMLINLNIHNQVVKDIPMSAIYDDETSNLSVTHSFLTFPLKIIKGLFKRIFYKYYIYDFNMASIYLLLSTPLLLFGFTFGLSKWIQGGVENVENSAGTIMLAALPIILGVQFLLQAISIDIDNVPKNNS